MHSAKSPLLTAMIALLLVLTACYVRSPVAPTPGETVIPASPLPATAAPTQAPSATSVPASIRVLSMLDENNGWALTDSGVERTMSGGATWFDVTPAGLNGSALVPFFLNSTTAWLCEMGNDPTSGRLYLTNNGGETWSSTAVPFGGGSLHFSDLLNGWALVGLSAGMSHEAVAIFRSTDGGITWTKVFTNDPGAAGSSDSLPLVGDKNGIRASDSGHAWVTGAQPSDNFIYLYTSPDGGLSWVHPDLGLPAAYAGAMTNANPPVFFGGGEVVLPVSLYAQTDGSDFYVSHDGGQSWNPTTPVDQGGIMAAASPADFFVWDGGPQLNASHDGGMSWSTTTPNLNIKDRMNSLQFVNATTGWVLASDSDSYSVLYKTTDGGATWNILIP